MKKHILLIASFLLLTGSYSFASVDNSVMYGVSANYNRTMYNGSIPLDVTHQDLSYTYQGISGNGYSIGLSTRISIPFLNNEIVKSSINGNLSYINLPGKASHLSALYPSLIETSPGIYNTTEKPSFEYKLDMNYSLINLGLCYTAGLFNTNFSVDIGCLFGFAIQNHYIMSMNSINDIDITKFKDNLREIDSMNLLHVI